MSFTANTRVKEIAVANPGAKKVLDEAGLDYCCGGERPLHDACMHAGVSAEEILKRLQENSTQVAPEEANWTTAVLQELTHHIVTKHHGYVRESIPRVRALLAKVKGQHGANHPELAAIEERFFDLGEEMYGHMQKEEQILFPYIEALERATNEKRRPEPPFFGTARNPIHMMMQEHDSAGVLLAEMRKLSSGYQVPKEACESYRELYRSLEEFEKDMHTHVHLENNILFPRTVALEERAS
ncbi:MAG TPA: iron-sulfur cluster repair di-iron protein [Candidatus Angelobacter sp.]|nr:iron-sulfur cluster repair di-iron protein [Candidatus Angelobacter sp.]